MSYLHAVLLVVLFVVSLFSWFIAVSGAMHWFNDRHEWPWFDRIVWWTVFAVAVAATAGLLVVV